MKISLTTRSCHFAARFMRPIQLESLSIRHVGIVRQIHNSFGDLMRLASARWAKMAFVPHVPAKD